MTEGSLCTGYNGLGMAVEAVFGTTLAWYSEIDKHAVTLLEHHYPGVRNLGDLTKIDWTQVPPVDVLTAGYPCQPFSHAGKRQGAADERHLWPFVLDAIRVLRPGLVVLENVAGHLSLGFDTVLGDLAGVGFDAEWRLVRASDVGACHRRARLFVVAHPGGERHGGREDPGGVGRVDREDAGQARERQRSRPVTGDRGATAAADAGGERRERRPAVEGARRDTAERSQAGDNTRDGGRPPAPDPDSTGLEGRGSLRGGGGQRAARSGGVAPEVDWGAYAPAIARHAHACGRPAPSPTDDQGRLSPVFVEWMMMLPEGWVTGHGLSRAAALRCLGNGVVPRQAEHALRGLVAS